MKRYSELTVEEKKQYHREAFNLWKAKNAEIYRERNREHTRDWRKRNPDFSKKYRMIEKNWIKEQCRQMTHRAIRKGILKKGLCEVCRSNDVQAHHDDYNNPMLVRWVCLNHHTEIHKILDEKAKKNKKTKIEGCRR